MQAYPNIVVTQIWLFTDCITNDSRCDNNCGSAKIKSTGALGWPKIERIHRKHASVSFKSVLDNTPERMQKMITCIILFMLILILMMDGLSDIWIFKYFQISVWD